MNSCPEETRVYGRCRTCNGLGLYYDTSRQAYFFLNGNPHIAHQADFFLDNSVAPEKPSKPTDCLLNPGRVSMRVTDPGTYYRVGDVETPLCTAQDEQDPGFDVKLAEKLGVEVKEIMAARYYDIRRPTDFTELADVLGSTIRFDAASKLILLCAGVLTFTSEDQVNVTMSGESSAGKSYTTLEVANYFPRDIVRILATASPRSFYHDSGEYDKDRKLLIVDLKQKLIIFLDQPDYRLTEAMRPLLSHDRRELLCKISDKNRNGGNRTKNVLLIGFPTVFYCAAKSSLDPQELTRAFVLSPQTSQSKLEEAVLLRIKRDADREAFSDWANLHPRRRWLKSRIEAIRKAGIDQIIVQDQELVRERFMKTHQRLAPRHPRDISRILSLIKAHALLNLWHREHIREHTIVATKEDIDAGFTLYNEIAESNELGLSPQLYEIYTTAIKPLLDPTRPLRKDEIASAYLEHFGRPLAWRRLDREILPALEAATLIRLEPDPSDRRRTVVYPPHAGNISRPQTILPQSGGPPQSNTADLSGTSPKESPSQTDDPKSINTENPRHREGDIS
jgi:hypothetical protein